MKSKGLTVLGALALGFALATTGGGRALAGQLLNVFVQGGSVQLDPAGANPVTVANTPSVTISGTPTVAIAGSQTVSLSGTPNVTVAGDTTGFTHLRRKASDLVFLTSYDNPNGSESKLFVQVGPGQEQSYGAGNKNTGYLAPAGTLLIVTDFNWRVFAESAAATGDVYAVLNMGQVNSVEAIVSTAHMNTTGVDPTEFGVAASSVHLTSGLAVRAPMPLNGVAFTSDGSIGIHMGLYGYLVQDE